MNIIFHIVRWLLATAAIAYTILLGISIVAVGSAGHSTIGIGAFIAAIIACLAISYGLIFAPKLLQFQRKSDRLALWITTISLLLITVFLGINLREADDLLELGALLTLMGLILYVTTVIMTRIIRF